MLIVIFFALSARADLAVEIVDAKLKSLTPEAARRLWSDEKLDVRFETPEKPARVVGTCAEFVTSDLVGYNSTSRMVNGKREDFDLPLHCARLKAIIALVPAKKSFLGEVNLANDWRQLPLVVNFGEGERSYRLEAQTAAKNGTTLWSWGLDSYEAVRREGAATKTTVQLRSSQLMRFNVLARGDANGDGIEDLVVETYSSRGRQNFNAGFWVLTKKEGDKVFRSVDLVTYGGSLFDGLTSKLESQPDSNLLDADFACAGDVIQEAREAFKKLYVKNQFDGAIQALLPVYQKCEKRLAATQTVLPKADIMLAMSKLPDGKARCEKLLAESPTPAITYASPAATRSLGYNQRKCLGDAKAPE